MAQSATRPARVAAVKLVTPRFRVSFPQVWTAKAVGDGVPRFTVVSLFAPATMLATPVPPCLTSDKAAWAGLLAACDKLAREAWKKSYQEAKLAGGYTLPFHKGTEKEYAGYGEGIVFSTLSAYKNRPGVVDKDGKTPILSESDFYPGCYARASITPYIPSKFPKTMCFGLNNLQKLDEGERLDSFTSAEEDFGSDTSEYDPGMDGDADETGGDEFDPAA